MKNILKLILSLTFFIQNMQAQTTAIPDTAFEQKLIALGIDSDGLVNGQILDSDAAAVTNLNVSSSSISDLTGIGAFINLTVLDWSWNNLISLDVTNNTALTNLDVTNHPLLIWLVSTNNLPYLNICVPNLKVANSQTYWFKDSSAIYLENCYPLSVTGQVVLDNNSNCIVDSLESGFAGNMITFINSQDTAYSVTYDSLGNYTASLDTGTYVVNLTPQSPYWLPCPLSQQVTIDSNYNVQQVDWSLQAITSCPYLTVDISAPFLRMTGGGSSYTVSYCNNGTADALYFYQIFSAYGYKLHGNS